MTTIEPRALSIPDFTRWAAIGRSKAYMEIQAGRLKTRKIGSRTVIPLEDAKAWFEAQPSGFIVRGAKEHG
ncbi:DNA-binding protein [Mesorhizobium sp.]|uniref:DNA-binding protein n=1 Tax=Mesorhizobium sp. TaxID=1871066 RepID=UPI000FE92281|nr:DNA-binding protein [Mesorhizobium sp.]RWG07546.1 MAG: DNA-binding protein [Mesorhizobium sp.]RWG93653.1 MAG: DNA-binding protein [Mesorhizobium sp.]